MGTKQLRLTRAACRIQDFVPAKTRIACSWSGYATVVELNRAALCASVDFDELADQVRVVRVELDLASLKRGI
jgi:hypothetical protein